MPKWFELRTVDERGAARFGFFDGREHRALSGRMAEAVSGIEQQRRRRFANHFDVRIRLKLPTADSAHVVRLEPGDAVRFDAAQIGCDQDVGDGGGVRGGNADFLEDLDDERFELRLGSQPVFGRDGNFRHGNLPVMLLDVQPEAACSSARLGANRSTVAPLVEIPKWKTSLSMPSRANACCIAAPVASPPSLTSAITLGTGARESQREKPGPLEGEHLRESRHERCAIRLVHPVARRDAQRFQPAAREGGGQQGRPL